MNATGGSLDARSLDIITPEHYEANGARLVLVKPRRADSEVFLHSEGGDSFANGGEA